MTKRTIWLLLWVILPALSFAKDDINTLFDKGNREYKQGHYKEALSLYQQVLNEGYESGPLYFNMGNASYKDNDIAQAIWYYEKAHRLSPSDGDISINLRLANLKTADRIDTVPELFFIRWWHSLFLSFSLDTLAVLTILSVLIASALFILFVFAKTVSAKKSSFYGGIVLLVIGLFFMLLANRQSAYFGGKHQAIVFSGSSILKGAPDNNAANLTTIHEGTKVNLIQRSNNGWIRISLSNGNEGWIRAEDVKEI
jgi:tetratricopeptide (TPR) repeat protein